MILTWCPTGVNWVVLGEIGINVHIATVYIMQLLLYLSYSTELIAMVINQVMLLTVFKSCLCFYLKNFVTGL